MHILAITPGKGFDAALWARVLQSGVDGFLVREPGMEAGPLLRAVRWCAAEAPEVEVWARGRLDIALAAGCGLHAPEGYPPVPPNLAALSRPLHQPSQFRGRRDAAQLLIAPVLPVPGKGPPWGLEGLHAFLDGLSGPAPRLLALGGVAPSNAAALKHPRLDGVALIRALWDAPEPSRVVDDLRAAWA